MPTTEPLRRHNGGVEAAWERKEAPLALDLEGARRLLSHLSFQVFDIALIPEGRANTNYRIETQLGPCVLSLDQGRKERADFSILAPVAVPVPQIRAVGPGFTLYDWIPGVSLEQALLRGRALPYPDIARGLAQARLAMSEVRCRSAGFFDPEAPGAALDLSGQHDNPLIVKDPWPSAVEGLLGWLRHILPDVKLAQAQKDRIAHVADAAQPRLDAIAGPPVLVHGDYKPSNLLVDETGLTAVLDWEFAHAGTHLSDVGQLLRHPETLPDGFAAAFLEGMGMDKDELLLARTLDLVNLVDFLHKERDQPRLRADVERRVSEVCDLYERRFGISGGG